MGAGTQTGADQMDFKTAVRTCLSKYATFSGRAGRSEYWWFVLFLLLAGMAVAVVDAALFGLMGQPIAALWSLAMILPTLAAGTRRLHDTGRSGWFQLVAFIPAVGWLILLYFYVSNGAAGPNAYGPANGQTGPASAPPARRSIADIPRIPRDQD
jgi:uncharacterized membrane protein YhaH (DUF805 family)